MTKENIKTVVTGLCKVAVFGTVVVLSCLAHDENAPVEHKQNGVNYYDAVRAIMGTGMFASDKHAMVATMKHNASEGYYKAVIDIAKSGMFASDKIEMVKTLN